MSTCKDCLHINVCKDYASYDKDSIISCDNFKNKADYVAVVRCKDCKYSRPRNESEKHRYFEGVLICESCEMADEPVAVCFDDFCSYGEKESEVRE